MSRHELRRRARRLEIFVYDVVRSHNWPGHEIPIFSKDMTLEFLFSFRVLARASPWQNIQYIACNAVNMPVTNEQCKEDASRTIRHRGHRPEGKGEILYKGSFAAGL